MNKLPSLNGLRAISIVIVIFYHLSRFNLRITPDLLHRFPIFDGRFGVGVFFVISGFLITFLLMAEEESVGRISVGSFYLRRILRIFPAYFMLLGVYFVLQRGGFLAIPRDAWITSLTYTKYLNYQIEWYTSHAWSLSIEENFYLLWPLMFLMRRDNREMLAVSLILLVPLVRLYAFYYPVNWIDEQSLFVSVDSVAFGCLFALRKTDVVAILSRHWNRYFYGSLILLFLIPWLDLAADGTYFRLFFILFGVLTGTTASLLIVVIIAYSMYGPRRSWFSVLNSKALNYVGTLSYSLYLWQQLFVAKSGWWVTHFPQNVVCIFLAALVSRVVIERPFLRLKERCSSAQKRTFSSLSVPEASAGSLENSQG